MTLFNDPLKDNDPLKIFKIDLFIIYRELRKKCRITRQREFVRIAILFSHISLVEFLLNAYKRFKDLTKNIICSNSSRDAF